MGTLRTWVRWLQNTNWQSRGLFVAAIFGLLLSTSGCGALTELLLRASDATPTPAITPIPTPGPQLQVSPPVGGPGTPVTVVGQGWRPADTVFIRLEDPVTGDGSQTAYAAAIVSAAGEINVTFTFPSDPRWAELPAVLIVAWSPATGAEASGPFQVIALTPTATPTSTATATSVPTPSPIPGNRAHVVGGIVNVRSGPGVTYAIIGTAAGGDTVLVLGQNPAGDWLQVYLTDGRVVWIARSLTDCRGTAPVGYAPTPPPPPPPAPTRTPVPGPTATPWINPDAWRGEYFANADLAGNPALVRNDANVDFNWGYGGPGSGIPANYFSARWTRDLGFDAGNYRFHVVVDDGARLFIDGNLVINEWRDGSQREVTTERYLGGGTHNLRVEYYQRTGTALIYVWWEKVSNPSYPDWKGEYWSNRWLDGKSILTRNDRDINFNWGTGSPDSRIPNDNFSARWTHTLNLGDGLYRFHLRVDDGARLWVDDGLLIDEWRDGSDREVTADLALYQGQHSLRVEFYERTGKALIHVWWEKIGPTDYPDWKGEYWSNRTLTGQAAVTRNDPVLDFQWGSQAPMSGLPNDNFSIRWTRRLDFADGVYRFSVQAANGVRFYVDGALILDAWRDNVGSEVYVVDQRLSGSHQLKVEYYKHSGVGMFIFWWGRLAETLTPTPTLVPTVTPTYTPIPTASAVPTATPTHTPSPTPTPTRTATITPTATHTPVSTATPSPTSVAQETPTPTATATATTVPTTTETPADTSTPTATSAPVSTATPSPTSVAQETPTATVVATATATIAAAATATTTSTPISTATPSSTSVVQETPTATETSAPMPTATDTATVVPTTTETPIDTPLPTATDTPTAMPAATETSTPIPTATDTATVVPTVTHTPTAVPAATSTDTPVPAPTAVPTSTYTPIAVPTHMPTSVPPATATAVPTATPTPNSNAISPATKVPPARRTPVPTRTPKPARSPKATPVPPPTQEPAPQPTPVPPPAQEAAPQPAAAPAIQVSAPAAVKPGATIKVAGSSWPGDKTVRVTLRVVDPPADAAADVAEVGVDANGQFAVEFILPQGEMWATAKQVEIVAHTTDGAVQVAARLAIAP
jgi:hypothetical protein